MLCSWERRFTFSAYRQEFNLRCTSTLQKLQNRAARIITLSNYDRNTDELLHSLNWHKLEHQRAVSKSIVMYNAVNNQTPNYLSSVFSRVMKPSLTYNLRNALIIVNEVLATAGLCYGIAYRMK